MASDSSGPDAVLDRLTRLHPKVIDLSLGRVERLLAALDDPQDRLPPVVHVAGTNGKGSLIAYLRAFLEAAGERVHVYISPHLVRFNERIRVAGRLIDDDALSRLLEECETANAGAPITFFEITTATAFLAFARTPADVVLLETGLGGRLDATNVVQRPVLTALTPISMDHMQYLGPTLLDIAGEKAGILKPGAPCVLGLQEPEVAALVTERARSVGAPLIAPPGDWSVRAEGEALVYTGRDGRERRFPLPALPGPHQIGNAGLAIACAEALPEGLRPDDAAIARGLRSVEWPARLQRLTRGPLIESLPQGWELWLDGGHNEAAGKVLAAMAASAWRDRPLDVVFGMQNTKEPENFLRPLASQARRLRAVAIPGAPASLSAEDAAEAARRAGLNVETARDVPSAVADLAARGPSPARILVCGSLYLAGSVLAENG